MKFKVITHNAMENGPVRWMQVIMQNDKGQNATVPMSVEDAAKYPVFAVVELTLAVVSAK